jgi:hypothetical protein
LSRKDNKKYIERQRSSVLGSGEPYENSRCSKQEAAQESEEYRDSNMVTEAL